MKIPALTDLAKDVKRIAEALTRLATTAEELVKQQRAEDAKKEENDLWR